MRRSKRMETLDRRPVNMDGYIGTSVKKEIEYAEMHGKEVLYHYNQ